MDSPAELISILVVLLFLGSIGVWFGIFNRALSGREFVRFEYHPSVPWSGWDVALLLFAYIALDGVAIRLIGGAPQGLSATALAAMSVSHLVWLGLAVMYLALRTGASLDDLGFDFSRLSDDLRLGATTFLAVVLPVYGVQLLFTLVMDIPSEHPLVKLAKEQGTVATLVVATFSAAIVAPLTEEFLFRVLLQGWLEKKDLQRRDRYGSEGGPAGLTPLVIVSIVFGMMHFGYGPDPIALFLLALFLGYLYRQTHRIAPPLVVHVCVNSLAVLGLWAEFLRDK